MIEMDKKVIFQIVTHFEMGGAERIAFNIAESENPDFEYHIVEVAKGNSAFTQEMIKELDVHRIVFHRSDISNNKKAILYFPFRLKKLIAKYHPVVIHTHTEVPDLAVYLFHLIFPFIHFKLVRTLHNTVLWNSWGKIGKIVERYVQKKNANVSNSIAVTKAYLRNFGGSAAIPLIYNGFKPTEQKKYQGIVMKKINVLFAGRFVHQKGLPVLVDVIKRVNPERYFFHVAGTGPMEEYVQENLGNLPNVKITGPIANLASYVGSFDFVFIPSVHEGLNSLSIEASMNGTPAIINDIDGLNETLPQDWNLKVSDNSVEQYSDIFDKIYTLDRTKIKEQAYSFVDSNFSIRKMQREYEKLYQQSR